MPIIDIQRRLREAGRIRIGEQVAATKRDGTPTTRPSKLDAFRFTSPDKVAIGRIAELYGGTAQKWDDAPTGDQWEVFSDATTIPVVIPPYSLGFSQWYELWAGGGCQRRCDGEKMYPTGTDCQCKQDAPDGPLLCKPHTRLSLMLSDLEGIGTWRLDTSGIFAAQELFGTMEVVQVLHGQGRMVTGRLVLNQREIKRPGEQTRKFAVPGLDLDTSIVGELTGRRVTPIPPSTEPVPSIAEQVRQSNERGLPAPRSNAAEPIPPTGVEPRVVLDQRRDLTIQIIEALGEFDQDEVDKISAWLRSRIAAPQDCTMEQLGQALDIIVGWPESATSWDHDVLEAELDAASDPVDPFKDPMRPVPPAGDPIVNDFGGTGEPFADPPDPARVSDVTTPDGEMIEPIEGVSFDVLRASVVEVWGAPMPEVRIALAERELVTKGTDDVLRHRLLSVRAPELMADITTPLVKAFA